jgi:capsular polysaccharide biosynthesis protein
MPHPDDPRRPVPWLNMLIAAVSGLILALVYAFVADHYDHTIKSIDDAERYLGVPVLGSVPKLGRHIIRTG